MSKDLKPLFGFRHLVTSETSREATASLQAKVGGKAPKTPAEPAVLAAKVGAKVG